MKWTDLLRMSGNNLVRRRLRTFLTVLGVVIGTASIVVMVSLGIGLRQSVYEAAEESGGLTSVSVSYRISSGAKPRTKSKTLPDDAIKKLGELTCPVGLPVLKFPQAQKANTKRMSSLPA